MSNDAISDRPDPETFAVYCRRKIQEWEKELETPHTADGLAFCHQRITAYKRALDAARRGFR